MKREFVRHVVVFGDYFKEFRKTLDREALMKKYFDQKTEQSNG